MVLFTIFIFNCNEPTVRSVLLIYSSEQSFVIRRVSATKNKNKRTKNRHVGDLTHPKNCVLDRVLCRCPKIICHKFFLHELLSPSIPSILAELGDFCNVCNSWDKEAKTCFQSRGNNKGRQKSCQEDKLWAKSSFNSSPGAYSNGCFANSSIVSSKTGYRSPIK